MKFWKYKGGIRIPEGGFTPKFNTPEPLALRPCLADGKAAVFHLWAEEATDRLNLSAGTLERNHNVLALVEYPDGSVGRVKPELIQFLDRKEG